MSAFGWLQQGTVWTLGWTLVHFLWQGAAAALLLALANAALRGHSPRARYGVGLALLLAMLAAPVVTFVAVHEPVPVGTPPVLALTAAVPAPPLPPSGEPSLAPPAEGRADPAAYLPALVAFWAAGVLLLSLRTLGGWLLVFRLRRSGRAVAGLQEAAAALARRMRISRPVRVCESFLVQVPTAMGWIKPMILLPPATLLGLSAAQLELVLAHELAHIRRLDPLAALLQAAAETLLFYHPAVWWVSHRLRVEREECCDDAAVAVCGNAVAYARTLATLEELRLRAPGPVMALSGGSLAARVRRLVSPPGATAMARWPVALLILLLAGAGVAPATLRAGSQPAATSEAPPADEAPAGAESASATEPQEPRVEPSGKQEKKPAPPAAERTAAPPVFTTQQIIAMGQAGVTPEFVEELEELGHRGLGSEELIELRQSGVTGDFVGELAELGYKLSTDQLIALRQQGVTPDYVRELAEEGLRDLSPGALAQLRNQGVTPDYAREMRQAAGRPFSTLELTMLRNQGVNPEDAAAFKASGHVLTAPRLAALRNQGVTADYVEELKALGYPQLSSAKLIALRSQGVTADYVRELQELGYRDLQPGALINLRAMGVTPEWVRELREAGWTGLSTDELVTLRSEGFQPHGWRRQR
jgi:beta-lactamase regulating signal transducer with metallopeptidase domain